MTTANAVRPAAVAGPTPRCSIMKVGIQVTMA